MAALLCAFARRSADAIGVATCEEFAAVDRATETKITITNTTIVCAEYTRLSIRSDAMVLRSDKDKVTFTNLALHVYGSLTVQMDVQFTGIKLVVCL